MGAGTGLFSWQVSQKYPKAEFVLYDVASAMLDLAQNRFRDSHHNVSAIVDDFLNIREFDAFDLVISSLSVHHLNHPDKRKLFGLIYESLKSSGAFINIDQIKGETQAIEDLYWSTWLDEVRQAGGDGEQIQKSIKRRQELDQDALLVDQLQWLKDVGFVNVDCVYKHYFVGVFFATKQ